ncbi:uncharacterized protein LOC119613445 [Lucilia sericata]|uniref:uncharacterized protein LOC119613445 n=1 Tax=Lucilia sericata TaxID=13632 RepID=UPI0018A7E9F9|nr:uncharacterized protein LOC119613445 [Lucilia sericata]
MNLNRARNVFTLGNFQLASNCITKRSKPSDPFERDPFKIQSYNFRYADRPTYPIAAVPPRVIQQPESLNKCQTYFYNPNFPVSKNSNGPTKTSSTNVERALNLSKFQEYRRRKFLQEPAVGLKRPKEYSKNYESKILNLYYGADKDIPLTSSKTYNLACPTTNYNIPPKASQASVRNCYKSDTVKPSTSNRVYQSLASSNVANVANSRSSISSGYEININIKNLDHNSLQDSVNIKIETDSIYRNLNIPQTKNSHKSLQNKSQLNTSQSFVIDKRLSKFSVKPETKTDLKMSSNERVKQLTSIYQSNCQIPKKSVSSQKNNKLNERLPSLIPLNTNSPRSQCSSSNGQVNSFRKVKDNSKVYDCKAKSKSSSCSNNNLYSSSPYITINKGSKLLNSSPYEVKSSLSKNYNCKRQSSPLESSIHTLHSAANRCDFKTTAPLRMRSSIKLPLNVNINVFADKLKLMKI